ncbi:hypothetical protein Afil01_54960 [Actinorhabdospora filicis]|uniref:Uncharacterized protein n=1 Tax=Actinorhabdospora filicis TaxID=1785913 RepID=A0A9W6WBJ7_9ACTN|nr:hypothetical protein [Actinorhabdospora filicis]GLZ80689.1 hypothetical protein Afil01_54960 [Actinorhabdospora filicis]
MTLVRVDTPPSPKPPPPEPLPPRWRGVLALLALIAAMMFFLQLLDRGYGIALSLRVTAAFVVVWLICAGMSPMVRGLKRALGRI